jgi:hypothetical protein
MSAKKNGYHPLYYLFILLMCFPLGGASQDQLPYQIEGIVVKNNIILEGANVTLIGGNQTVKTNQEGYFIFRVSGPGKYNVYIFAPGCLPQTLAIEAWETGTSSPVMLVMPSGEDVSKFSEEDLIPIVSIHETNDQSQGSDFISGILTASRDVFVSTTAFTLGPLRFRIRGLDGIYSHVYINGVPVNDIENGRVSWNVWGGLNDVLRDRDIHVGNALTSYGMGSVGGISNMNVRAGNQWRQTRISTAISNRNYRHRLMFTHNTGFLDNGWAFSFSGSLRYAHEGYIEGTSFEAYSYFVGVEKRLSSTQFLSATLLGSYMNNGLPGGSFQEMYDLAQTPFYNPNWGYQNGVKRNARVRKTHQPMLFINHDWKISSKTKWQSAVAVQTGRTGVTALDWYNAPDPRPDYYRRLPSFAFDPHQKDKLTSLFQNDEHFRQINWDQLYHINQQSIETIENVGGVDNQYITGKRSRYIIEERRSDIHRVHLNTILHHNINQQWHIATGGYLQVQQVNYFKTVNDLLGGDFYVNLNPFAERDIPNNQVINQHDINRPNRILTVGDRFGYDYASLSLSGEWWAQVHYRNSQWEHYVAGSMGISSFKRIGFVQNGLFPEQSLGHSPAHSFLLPLLKAGTTFKINGRNYIVSKITAGNVAPQFRNVFVSPRTRDQVASNLRSEALASMELGYWYTSPSLKLRMVGYVTQINHQIRTQSFYHDEKRTFVNHTLSGLNALHSGVEIGSEVKLSSTLTTSFVAAISDNRYTSRPTAEITVENNPSLLTETQKVYLKHFFVSGSPQQALSLGLNYRSPKYWFINLNVNWIDGFYLDPNPIRRTSEAVSGLEYGSLDWKKVLYQEKLPSAYTVDLFGGYSIKCSKYWHRSPPSAFLYLNVGVSNILHNLNVITGGFEQNRFDFQTKDVDRFPPRYFYQFGRNYFINITYKF